MSTIDGHCGHVNTMETANEHEDDHAPAILKENVKVNAYVREVQNGRDFSDEVTMGIDHVHESAVANQTSSADDPLNAVVVS